MLRTLLTCLCLLALGACATHPAAPGGPPSATTAAVASAGPPVGCVNGTGTRLPVAPQDCTGVGASYSRGQLQSTGTPPYLQNALQMLDPSIRASGAVP